ncbi:MAG: 2-enoyl thioester reductase domain-containing protein [Chthoniobacteraceae bacterium]
MRKVSAIVIQQHGDPLEVPRVEERELPPPGPLEAVIEMLAAPINPADLNVIEGTYPIRPELPGVPGGEGVGRVLEIGTEVDGLAIGETVLLPHGFGSWREAGIAAVDDLIRVPAGLPLAMVAMLKINPATALCMLRAFETLSSGDWLAQNAANSGVGRAVIQIAHHYGLKTLNFVRDLAVADELKADGATVVLRDEKEAKREWPDFESMPPRLALNAVGGDSATRLAGALAPGGTLVTYGAMARQPVRLPNGLLIFGDIRARGFWITKWYREASPDERAALFAELFRLIGADVLKAKVERTYPVTEAAAAIRHATQSGRGGKILFAAPGIDLAHSRS